MMTDNLRERKVGSCGLCSKWEFISKDWGICRSVNENSEIRGHVLTGIDPELQTRKDFGCRQFQEMDIWRA